MKLVDIHMHVVPDVDDGSRNLKESLEMLRLSQQQGVETVFATPHSFAFDVFGAEMVLARFQTLQEAVRENEIPIELRFG